MSYTNLPKNVVGHQSSATEHLFAFIGSFDYEKFRKEKITMRFSSDGKVSLGLMIVLPAFRISTRYSHLKASVHSITKRWLRLQMPSWINADAAQMLRGFDCRVWERQLSFYNERVSTQSCYCSEDDETVQNKFRAICQTVKPFTASSLSKILVTSMSSVPDHDNEETTAYHLLQRGDPS